MEEWIRLCKTYILAHEGVTQTENWRVRKYFLEMVIRFEPKRFVLIGSCNHTEILTAVCLNESVANTNVRTKLKYSDHL